MSEDWPTVTLREVTQRITKGTTPTMAGGGFVPTGVNFIKVESITESGRIERDKLTHIDTATHAHLARSILEEDDVLFTIAGTIGRSTVVPSSILPANTNQAVAIVRPDKSRILPRYLYYALRDDKRLAEVLSRVVQSVQANFSLGELAAIRVSLPQMAEQRAIAEVLARLDDKMEANRQLTTHCDSAWRALLEAVTDGEVVPLVGLADFVNGGAFTKDASGSGRMVVRIAELNSGPGGSTVYNDIDVKPDHLANLGDLLFAWSGSLGVYRWCRTESIINQHIFKVIPKPGVPMWLVHGRILDLLPMFRSIAAEKATTMGHIQRRHLDGGVVVPGPEVLGQLKPVCQGLWDRALAAERENLILADLRDTLLPELMSGRIRVREMPKSNEELSA
jgi:type I restriction enzyme S subunit